MEVHGGTPLTELGVDRNFEGQVLKVICIFKKRKKNKKKRKNQKNQKNIKSNWRRICSDHNEIILGGLI